MHREILNAPTKICVDHINHDSLDNRRSNLRLCDKRQNNNNSRKYNASFLRGVRFRKREKKFVAEIKYKNKKIHLGYFTKAEDAAMAYDKASIKYHGEFGIRNYG